MNAPQDDQCFPVVAPLSLPSNLIKLQLATDETEPREVTAWATRVRIEKWVRFSIGVNTYYPEVFGGHYRNRALIRLVQECFRDIESSIILCDSASSTHPCPDEIDGLIDDQEEYNVVQHRKIVGALLRWELHVGGGSDFIRDAVVLSLVGSATLAKDLFDAIERRCSASAIRIVRY